jgi:dTMP kinase
METELSADRGRLITVEGIEGAGKTTNLEFAVDWARKSGCEVIATREPGGTELGEALRELLLANRDELFTVEAEALAMFAARAEHIERVIEPALAGGAWVVCDRFTEATYAYQGGGRGLALSRIAALEDWVQGALRPDLTVLLDVSPEVGLKRARERSGPDRFEQEQIDFFERAREVYLRRAAQEMGRYAVIDAEQDLAHVRSAIADAIDRLIEAARDGDG